MTIIKGKGFILRPLKVSDAKEFLESNLDKESKKGFMTTPKNLSEAKKELKECVLSAKQRNSEGLAIIVDGKYAGNISIHGLSKDENSKHIAKIGYCIHPNFRGRGLATKVLKVTTDYAFKKYNLKRLVGVCRTFNKASARVLEKAGYKLEGIMRKNKFKDGKYLDDMVWAKVK
jgi:RimJ/RimL family protein N-acetyltransferase